MNTENTTPTTVLEAKPVNEASPPAPPPVASPASKPPTASGKAIAALVMGILSLICCGFFAGIPAIIVGKQELNNIRDGKSPSAGQAVAQIGFILGIVGTILTCLASIAYVLLIIFGISMGTVEGIRGA